ncbi:DUF2536 family protein [Evansella sp. AB-P1]|uniref:DUF2536 family protein n=1 Tax=Evansella sp. AB-P1 TaxID=3037653 RepID=UPI00241F0FFE|nr:DUF2536 family protein [Evansella sp. AB-P1]MDG5786485.1 DUF2536 family protein [Evansella sp. AB-P1]
MIHTGFIEDKVEFFETKNLQTLEKQIATKIEQNQAIMLSVNHVSHQVLIDPVGSKLYTAVVHFKGKK